jgi:agmatine/peptidylarginine deiminase
LSTLIAEWEKQDAVILIYPHEKTDWNYNLLKVRLFYHKLVEQFVKFGKVILIIPENMDFQNELDLNYENLIFLKAKTNDTWIRDNGPIFIKKNNNYVFLNFKFNGWGNRFNFEFDNELNDKLFLSGIFGKNVEKRNINFVLEGGSIDHNSEGVILTTQSCLLNKNRNPQYSKETIEKLFSSIFEHKKILWLKYGKLMGDHTDSHIDMLAKFANKEVIVYSKHLNPNYPYYNELNLMEKELSNFRNHNDKQFDLIPLFLPEIRDKKGNFLPATYTNFFIFNNAVFVPIYCSKEDEHAIDIFEKIFSDKLVIPIDSRILVTQGGSLHCATNNIPHGFLGQ